MLRNWWRERKTQTEKISLIESKFRTCNSEYIARKVYMKADEKINEKHERTEVRRKIQWANPCAMRHRGKWGVEKANQQDTNEKCKCAHIFGVEFDECCRKMWNKFFRLMKSTRENVKCKVSSFRSRLSLFELLCWFPLIVLFNQNVNGCQTNSYFACFLSHSLFPITRALN